MSTFYVLPPRPVLGDHLARVLQEFFPGLDWNLAERARLAELVDDLVSERKDVYVVHREDLPSGESLSRALADGFGAEEGDEIVEIRPVAFYLEEGAPPRSNLNSRRWPVQNSLPTSGEYQASSQP